MYESPAFADHLSAIRAKGPITMRDISGTSSGPIEAAKAHIAAAPRRHLVFATVLTMLAGFLDAVGYTQLGHLYVSFMSGNSTQLGIAIAQGHGILLIVTIIGAFVAGGAIGTLVAEADANLATVTVLAGELVAFLFAIGLVLIGHDRIGLVFVAIAMGMQNNLHQVIAGADVGKGFITGALFALGQSLARLVKGKANAAQAASNAWSWISFVGGVAIGAATIAGIGLLASLTIVAALALIAIVAICAGWL